MIFLNVMSNLAGMAYSISIERDWFIVIAQSENELAKSFEKKEKINLTQINSNVRRINLGVSVLAPLFAGGIITFLC